MGGFDVRKRKASARLAVAGAGALALSLVGCGGDDESPEADPRVAAVSALTGNVPAGEQLYLSDCIGCHLADGTGRSSGGAGKDLTVWLPGNPDAAAIDAVLNGRMGMLAYGPVYGDQDVADLIAYLRATFDP